jgi:hypothetical protein
MENHGTKRDLENDIVDRLRNPNFAKSPIFAAAYMSEAADEIEFLRRAVKTAARAIEIAAPSPRPHLPRPHDCGRLDCGWKHFATEPEIDLYACDKATCPYTPKAGSLK